MPRTFLYPGPDLKFPAGAALSLGSNVAVAGSAETRGTKYALVGSGEALIDKHLAPLGHKVADYVSVAESLLNTPYLWGGKSVFGIDCSGLVQVSLTAAGTGCPRDSDMQQDGLGRELSPAEMKHPKRGDLIFWKGHVAIVRENLFDIDRLDGKGRLEATLTAEGQTFTQLRKSLNGTVRVGLTEGALMGVDMVEAIKRLPTELALLPFAIALWSYRHGGRYNAMLKAFYTPFHQLIEQSGGIDRSKVGAQKEVGTDPKTGKMIYARFGRFGPMLQLGSTDDEEKPQFAPMPAGAKIETVTLEQALTAFKLPRTVGQTADGQRRRHVLLRTQPG